MTIYVISDNQDSLTGLKLCGIKGEVVHEKEGVLRAINEVTSNPDVAILLITEKLAGMVKDKIHYIRMNLKTPLVVEIPDRHGSGRKKDFITSYINEAIGIKIDK